MLIPLISAPSAKVSALVGISEQQSKNGQTKQSQQTLVEAVQFVQSGNFDPFFKSLALSEIAAQYSVIGQQETAVKLFDLALAPPKSSISLLFNREKLIVAVGLLEAGRTGQAEKITQQFLQAVQKDPIGLPISPSVLQPLLTAGKYDFATRLVQQVRDPKYRTRWLSDICLSLVESGEFDRAVQLASNLPSDNDCSETLSYEQYVASTAIGVIELVKAGKTSTAISVTQSISAPHYKVLLLTEIAIELDEAGQAEQSKQILLQAIEQSSSLQRSVGLDYGAGLGKMQIAIRLAESKRFTKALEIAEMVEEDSYKVLAMLNIANQYIQNGEKAKALNVLSKTVEITAALKCKVCG
jgi:tetratricopeptide (TPR) repeat protein